MKEGRKRRKREREEKHTHIPLASVEFEGKGKALGTHGTRDLEAQPGFQVAPTTRY
jgi:hypothetical protein